eukprot:TRINITY_DN67149_c1_g2_i4.p1 TRINITY_DN67149_c1_g2~~TRINITY_DN67149_c1_g2_i4.p1  ORF type:complete len:155 (-),score=8.92 TRINITY_DN67149_c1_g2_i4:281-745(-)
MLTSSMTFGTNRIWDSIADPNKTANDLIDVVLRTVHGYPTQGHYQLFRDAIIVTINELATLDSDRDSSKSRRNSKDNTDVHSKVKERTSSAPPPTPEQLAEQQQFEFNNLIRCNMKSDLHLQLAKAIKRVGYRWSLDLCAHFANDLDEIAAQIW